MIRSSGNDAALHKFSVIEKEVRAHGEEMSTFRGKLLLFGGNHAETGGVFDAGQIRKRHLSSTAFRSATPEASQVSLSTKARFLTGSDGGIATCPCIGCVEKRRAKN